MVASREIHLKSRPHGVPRKDNFALVTVEVPEPGAGELLVRNIWMSVDPYMRGRMYDRESYVPPFGLDSALDGGAVGEVMRSNNPAFEPGDLVLHMGGWREFLVSDGTGLQKLPATGAPSELYLGLLGMPGMTAYFGLLEVAALKRGETVFVSSAAGAVGSVVCQLARIHDCRVIGSCGTEDKAEWLRHEMGVDAVINYRATDDLAAALRAAAPKGVDVYFDNVGGDHLEAALACMNTNGRIAACGMIADYNRVGEGVGVRNLMEIVGRRLTVRGFIVSDFFPRFGEAMQPMMKWYHEGRLNSRSTVHEGIEHAVDAMIGLFEGTNTGKMLVNLCSHEHGIEVEFI
jgi:NADPH-dependent curcumin reductase CurA